MNGETTQEEKIHVEEDRRKLPRQYSQRRPRQPSSPNQTMLYQDDPVGDTVLSNHLQNQKISLLQNEELAQLQGQQLSQLQNQQLSHLRSQQLPQLQNQKMSLLQNQTLSLLQNQQMLDLQNQQISSLQIQQMSHLQNQQISQLQDQQLSQLKNQQMCQLQNEQQIQLPNNQLPKLSKQQHPNFESQQLYQQFPQLQDKHLPQLLHQQPQLTPTQHNPVLNAMDFYPLSPKITKIFSQSGGYIKNMSNKSENAQLFQNGRHTPTRLNGQSGHHNHQQVMTPVQQGQSSQKNVHFMIRPEHGNRHAQNQPYSQQSKLHQEYYLTQIQNGGGGSVQPPKSSFNVPNQHKNSQMHASQSNYERDNCFGRVSNNTIITNVPFATENQLLNIQTNSSTIMMQNGLLIDISAKTNMPNQEN